MPSTCPVCGYPGLEMPARTKSGGGSYEICPSCGFQFGVDDEDRGETYAGWRERWIAAGSPWRSSRPAPRLRERRRAIRECEWRVDRAESG